MKDIKAIKGKFYIQRLIEEGEHEHQDFKFSISDARKIARSVSAFANNDGGRLLVGVKDNGNIAGVRNEEDIYVIEQAAAMYCRPAQKVEFTAFKTEGGAVVIRAEIARAMHRPVQAQEPDGTWRSYYRVKDENIVAPDLMVRAWRKKESQKGALLSFSDAESGLISLLEENKKVTIEEFMKAARISRHTAEDIIVKLYAVGMIDFTYTGNGFKIMRN
ncbi:MAG: ATP-binding protein [Muribaculaceae bacterium]|nr:ATP-binding protein [Muribaculaceae bacterium]